MTRLSQDNQECLQKHFRRPSMWKQFLPLQRAGAYNANIHQTTEKEGATKARYDIKVRQPPQSMILSWQGKSLSLRNIKPKQVLEPLLTLSYWCYIKIVFRFFKRNPKNLDENYLICAIFSNLNNSPLPRQMTLYVLFVCLLPEIMFLKSRILWQIFMSIAINHWMFFSDIKVISHTVKKKKNYKLLSTKIAREKN